MGIAGDGMRGGVVGLVEAVPMSERAEPVSANASDVADAPSQIISMLGRWPEIGRSKTRLAAAIGGVNADRVYRQLLRHCVSNALRACTLNHRRSIFFVDPPERVKVMTEWLGGDQVVYPQTEGDLGKKMRHAAQKGFDLGAEAVIVMGSDCPHLTPARLDRAFQELTSQQVVFGPSNDGGFYLLGLSEMIPELFKPMQWGSEHVMKTMRNRCRRLGVETAELEVLPDVDRVSDLNDEVLNILNLTRAQVFAEAEM